MQFAPRKITTTRGELTLRMATPDDVVPFRDLRLTALQTSPHTFGSSYEDAVLEPLDDWRARVARPNVVTAVLDAGDQFVGMAGIVREAGRKMQHTGFIFGVFVREEWRGMGLAGVIVAELLDVARREPGINKVTLSVVTDNPPAFHTYEKLGFQVYGTDRRALYVNGNYYDEHLMVLFLEKD